MGDDLPDASLIDDLVAGIGSDLDGLEPAPKMRTKAQLATWRHKKKRETELAYLKRAVADLHTQLAALTLEKEGGKSQTRWERLAKGERKRQRDAQRENRRLKEMLEEQVKFAECLVQLVHKQPKLTLISDDSSWRHLVLDDNPLHRVAAMHAIVDRAYDDLDSAFIAAGLIETLLNRHEYLPKGDVDLEVHTIVCVTFSAPSAIAAQAVWRVLRGSVDIKYLNGSYQLLADVDPCMTYVAGVRQHAAVVTQRRVIVKQYTEPDRFVVVCRSIHSDEAFPMDPLCAHSNEVSWLTVESLSPETSAVKFFQKSRPTRTLGAMGLDCKYLMESFSKNTLGFEYAIAEEIEKLRAC
ncbi:hypothetical protein ACHHYP_15708 [Achlya hypogyna]|uniref:M96 mating-specific protein family n=1 Tax=Achlya hypogyna TaxID=1202772 RepID=A0A1V9YA81_ACHHY|nr:hypothetical protein ACHHYP_15708 [Achlya hypogyna]